MRQLFGNKYETPVLAQPLLQAPNNKGEIPQKSANNNSNREPGKRVEKPCNLFSCSSSKKTTVVCDTRPLAGSNSTSISLEISKSDSRIDSASDASEILTGLTTWSNYCIYKSWGAKTSSVEEVRQGWESGELLLQTKMEVYQTTIQ